MLKIIQNNKVIDVIKTPSFINFLPSGHIAFTDKSSAKGVVGSDGQTVYSFIPSAKYAVVTTKEISAAEFEGLQKLLNSGQEISADSTQLEKAKTAKIKILSTTCKNKIIAGFSVKLSDGAEYNFKLTVEDQLNLMMLENQLSAGATTFIYHATEQPCKMYNREDVTKIIQAFRAHTLYHTTYFNIAKQYIKSLTSIEAVNMFTYGDDVSATTSDKALRQILKKGGIIE